MWIVGNKPIHYKKKNNEKQTNQQTKPKQRKPKHMFYLEYVNHISFHLIVSSEKNWKRCAHQGHVEE